jgi:multiple sugar transport system substrate-binding protein
MYSEERKEIMKKQIISALLASVMVLSFSACSGGNGGNAGSGTSAGGAKTTIEVWTNDRHDLDYVNSEIQKFNSSNPDNIQIHQTVITDDYVNMLSMAKSSGTAPDIAGISGSIGIDMNAFADTKMVLPLNDYIKKAGADFQKVTESDDHIYEGVNAVNGQVYWVPTVVRSGTRMIYNMDLVKKATGSTTLPTTLPEMVSLAKKITQKGAGQYYGFATTKDAPFVRCFEGIAEMAGQNRYGYDYVNGKFDFSGFKPIVEEFNKLFTDKSVLPGSPSQGVDAMRAQFANGKIGIWGNASQEAGVFTEQFPVKNFEWKVAELPTMDGKVQGALTIQPEKGYAIMSTTKHADQAWKVIEFFSSKDFLKGYLEKGYGLPFSKEMTAAVDTSKTGRISDFALKDYESVYPAAPSITIEGEDMQKVLWSAVMGQRNVDTAIQDLNTRYNKALDSDVASGKVKRLVIKDFDPLHPSKGTLQYLDK